MDSESRDWQLEANPGYAFGEMAKAFATAVGHEDETTRVRAQGRLARWSEVLRGMASGELRIGSRTPVKGLPAWVTPEVQRGGFATGRAAASGPMTHYERGIGPTRAAVFAHHLTEQGLRELDAMLTSGGYTIREPENAALLTVAWLVGAGEAEAAQRLVATLAPFGHRLRFVPRPTERDPLPPSVVSRETAGDARRALERYPANPRLEAMREALTVWNPLADEALSLWLETVRDGRVDAARPDDFAERADALLARYEQLAAEHTRCTKHRRPKENLAILLDGLRRASAGLELEPRRRGLLQHAVDAMVRRRGTPGSPEHSALRATQAEHAAQPTHHTLARIVVARVAALPADRGVPSLDPVVAPVTDDEARAAGVLPGTPIPRSIRNVVARTLQGTPEELVERGIVGSAEVLAELLPGIAAAALAEAYEDERLRLLMASTYEAFRLRRRSLLLLDLEHQVRLEELPWVQAVAGHRSEGAAAGAAMLTLTRLAELALDAFPGTIVPSPLVTELDALAREAGLDLPLVEELAADIFMGRFSGKFAAAARLAGDALEGTLYQRYYAIDPASVRDVGAGRFGTLCFARAGVDPGVRWPGPAANGKVLEQGQILTTHNLAALTGLGLALDRPALARRCFVKAATLTERLRRNPRPLRTIKDTAYAWRQMVFFLSGLPQDEQAAFVAWAGEELGRRSPDVRERLRPALDGLAHVVAGGTFEDGRAPGPRLLGWTTERHWMLDAAAAG